MFLKVLAKQFEQVDTWEYEVVLKDVEGREVRVFAIGLDTLTQEAPGGDLTAAYLQFPDIPLKDIERP